MGSNLALTVKTKHKHPIYFAVHYKYTNDVWYTKGWWSVTNTSTCTTNITTRNNYLYFHAHCNECGYSWGDSNHRFLCHKYNAFDSTNDPSDKENYEYENFFEKYISTPFYVLTLN